MTSDMQNEPFKGFYNDFWKLIKKFWIPEENETYWDDLIAETDALSKTYGKEYLMRMFVVDFCMDREYQYQNKTGSEIPKIIKLSDFLKEVESDLSNTITLNGEKYIKVDALKNKGKNG